MHMTLASLQSLLIKSTNFKEYARQNWSFYASLLANEDVSSIKSHFIQQPRLLKEVWANERHKYHGIFPTSAIHIFAWYGLERFIQAGDDLDCKNHQGWTAIFFASVAGKATSVYALVHSGADLNLVDKAGRSALSYAAKEGHFQCVQILVDNGADINLVDKDGQSALSYAAQEGHFQCVQILVDKGADIDLVDKDGQSALLYAAKARNLNSVQILVEKDADMNLVDKDIGSQCALSYLQGRRRIVAASNDVNADSKLIIPSHALSHLASREASISQSLQSLIIHDKHHLFLQAGFNQDSLGKGYLVEEIIMVCNADSVECGPTDNLKLAFAAETGGNFIMSSLVQQISKILCPFPGRIVLVEQDDNPHQRRTLFIPPWNDSGITVTWEDYILDHSIPLSDAFGSHSPTSEDHFHQKYNGSQIVHLDKSPSDSTETPSNFAHSQSSSGASNGQASNSQNSSTNSGPTSQTSSNTTNSMTSISGSGSQTQPPEPGPEDGDLYFSLTTTLKISGSTLKSTGSSNELCINGTIKSQVGC
jgi:predicted Fe-Mo cluster-binding NifX family protein